MSRMSQSRRSGFTLVELLVVIAIIAILAALTATAAVQAITMAKQTAILVELDSIGQAFSNYRNKYGEYPPNFSDINSVRRHLRKSFPRMIAAEENQISGTLSKLDQAQAVVFWLSGFSADSKLPLSGIGGPLNATFTLDRALHDFDPSRIEARKSVVDNTTLFPVYKPKNKLQPFVYFDTSRAYATLPYFRNRNTLYGSKVNNENIVYPYLLADGSTFANQGKFQLCSAGLDDKWGDITLFSNVQPNFPVGPYIGDYADNLVNFSTGNLENANQ